MKKLIIAAMLLGVVFTIYSCENKVGVLPTGAAASWVPVGCDTANLTYTGGIDTLINTQCATSGCHIPHSSSGAVDFTSYSALSTDASGGKNSKFYSYLVLGVPQIMPNVPQNGWNSCMKAKIEEWVLVGAPQ